MSDTFDHYGDALNQYVMMDERDDYPDAYRRGVRNPLHYHMKLEVNGKLRETVNSYLLDVPPIGEVWVAKKICRQEDWAHGYVYVHKDTWRKIEAKARQDKRALGGGDRIVEVIVDPWDGEGEIERHIVGASGVHSITLISGGVRVDRVNGSFTIYPLHRVIEVEGARND